MDHALYHCEHCGKFKYVYFTCKSRFCNSCGAKYAQDRASSITSKVINCKHRHIVFMIPEELRIFFRGDGNLLHLFFQACADTILSWFYKLNKSENFKPGFISTMHTFGRDLKWNPHIHIILTEGASFYGIKSYLFKTYSDGFYVYAKPSVNSKSQEAINYIIHYYGLYAKKYTHSSKLYLVDSTTKKQFRKRHFHWRARLLLAFGVDPLCCSCGQTMELVGVFNLVKTLILKISLLPYIIILSN